MGITWLSAKSKVGSASLYSTNITLNTIASTPFEYAYRVQVGIDENKNILIQPINKEKVLRGDMDEYSLLKIAVKKTYSRISSTEIMKQLGDVLNLDYSEEPLKFETYWDEPNNVLIIKTGVMQYGIYVDYLASGIRYCPHR